MNKTLFDNLTTGSFVHRLLVYMKAVGLNRIEIEYSGGGDSGGMDNMTFQPAVDSAVEEALRNDLEEELCNPIYARHGSFADGGGYYVNGVVSYQADNNFVYISGTDHNINYGKWDEETGEYEETEQEDWEECLYGAKDYEKEQKNPNGGDFQFAYLYARDFLKNKLPEEFHNRMIAEAATKNDEYTVSYVKKFS